MDWNIILPSIISVVGTILVAYISIIPNIKKARIDTETIDNAIKNSKAFKEITDTLKLNDEIMLDMLRNQLEENYWKYAHRSFDMTTNEVEKWNNSFSLYKKKGGNGLIAEYNDSLQMALREKEYCKEEKKYEKY